jgi:hypothetical protein
MEVHLWNQYNKSCSSITSTTTELENIIPKSVNHGTNEGRIGITRRMNIFRFKLAFSSKNEANRFWIIAINSCWTWYCRCEDVSFPSLHSLQQRLRSNNRVTVFLPHNPSPSTCSEFNLIMSSLFPIKVNQTEFELFFLCFSLME